MPYKPTHKTIMMLEIEHVGEHKTIAELIAARAHTIDKVENVKISTVVQTVITEESSKLRHFIGVKGD